MKNSIDNSNQKSKFFTAKELLEQEKANKAINSDDYQNNFENNNKRQKVSEIFCYYEGDNEEEKKKDFLKNGNIGDQIHYYPNNQLGILYYEIISNNNKKELKLIGNYNGIFDDLHYS